MAKLPGVTNHIGKGAQHEMLPSRHALDTLTGGDPMQRTLGQYAKATPVGAGALGASNPAAPTPGVMGMGPLVGRNS